MVDCCAVLLCGDRLTRGTRCHDGWWTRHCFLRAIRHHPLFFPMATCQGLTDQHSGVFWLTGCPDTGLGVCVYLAARHPAMCCCAPLSTLVKVLALLCLAAERPGNHRGVAGVLRPPRPQYPAGDGP